MKFKFNIAQMVFLKTDIDQRERMIIERREGMDGYRAYVVGFGSEYSVHYESELCSEANVLKKLEIDVNESAN